MFILGSCKALNLKYSGCCVASRTQSCISVDCYCDGLCHINKDCCSDIADIGCHPLNKTLGKTKSVGKSKFFMWSQNLKLHNI